MRSLRYLRHSAPHVKGINPVGHAAVPGYLAAIEPIVPGPADLHSTQAMLLMGSCSA